MESLDRQIQVRQLEKKTNHILHLLLSLITAGFWIPIWMYQSYSVGQYNSNIGKPPRKPYVLYALGLVVIALGVVFI